MSRARGRMLNRSIAVSDRLAELESDTLRMLHAWAIPHLDRDGRMNANPRTFRATVCPLLDHISAEYCALAMCKFIERGLCVAYIDRRGRRVLLFPNFPDEQRGLRYDREGPSKFGPPPDGVIEQQRQDGPPSWLEQLAGVNRKQLSLIPPSPTYSGVTPDLLRSHDGPTPDLLRVNEWNGNEMKGSEVRARARACAREEPAAAESTDGPERVTAEESALLDELRRHPALKPVATLAMARQALANMVTAGGRAPDAMQAVRDLGRQAATAATAGRPWGEDYLVDRFGRYTARRRVGGPGVHATPQSGDSAERQAEAEQDWLESDERATLAAEAKKFGV